MFLDIPCIYVIHNNRTFSASVVFSRYSRVVSPLSHFHSFIYYNFRFQTSHTRDIKILISLAVYKSPSGSANYSHFSAEIPCEIEGLIHNNGD